MEEVIGSIPIRSTNNSLQINRLAEPRNLLLGAFGVIWCQIFKPLHGHSAALEHLPSKTLINRITLSLRSTLITRASSLLQTAPPLATASVFFLMVSAICHFPLHPQRGSHVPYQSPNGVHAAYTPAAVGSVTACGAMPHFQPGQQQNASAQNPSVRAEVPFE